MNWRRVLSVIRKEWWHITRDRTSFILLLLSPVLALVTMAYAFSIDIKDVGIGVMNQFRFISRNTGNYGNKTLLQP